MLPSMKFQNGAQIQDGCQHVLSFEASVFNFFFKCFQDCLNLFQKFFFLKIKNGRKIQYGRFFAQKFMNFG
jgi:hypothetical protein